MSSSGCGTRSRRSLVAAATAAVVAIGVVGAAEAATVGRTHEATLTADVTPSPTAASPRVGASGEESSAAAAAAPTGVRFTGTPTVGALFVSARSKNHYCTASVVASPAGDVIATAAHCVVGSGVGAVFVSGYVDGAAPYGSWTVTAAYATPGWTKDRATTDDVAFLVVAPEARDGAKVEVQSITGANPLADAPAAGTTATVVAYDDGADDQPITCTATVTTTTVATGAGTAGYPTFDCGGYVDGTSGAPWLVTVDGTQEVAGVIGGLHQGGCYPNVSYTPAFSSATRTAYDAAVAGATPSIFPSPGSDGCTTGL
jgi:hypothetical protein